jgi:hypothetical protein
MPLSFPVSEAIQGHNGNTTDFEINVTAAADNGSHFAKYQVKEFAWSGELVCCSDGCADAAVP